MSTSTLGGHVNTYTDQQAGARRRRRKHSDDFKADAVASCMQPGMSMAAVAMAHGVNANLLRRWVREAELNRAAGALSGMASREAPAPAPERKSLFVPLHLPVPIEPTAVADIRIELRRGATAVTVTWPASAADECAAWMRELLR